MYIPVTIQELIEYGKDLTLSHRILNNKIIIHNEKTDENIQIPFNPLINKYYDFFLNNSYVFDLNEEQQNHYRYAPKTMSLELYGTVEFWSLLLYLNQCHSILDFDLTKVRIVGKDVLNDLLNEILIQEKY